MEYSVTQETFATLASYWRSGQRLRWSSPFVLPIWMDVWWQEFSPDAELYLGAVKEDGEVIGIAPLQIEGQEAAFAGSPDVCDYMDFIPVPGKEEDFFTALWADLRRKGVDRLELKHVRPDSTVFTTLADWARRQGCHVSCQVDAVSLEMDLPATWEEYLGRLTPKQRHELGRKLRRLGEMGNISYRTIAATATPKAMDTFVKLFTESRRDKAAFMTARMESFFRVIASAMAEAGLLRLGTLDLDSLTIATVMAFDYNATMYLYNSGYNPEYDYLSAGLLSKSLCIKDSIERGIKRFDFLKGDDTYKYHLGGSEVKLYSCQISVK